MNTNRRLLAPIALAAALVAGASSANDDPAAIITALDTEYQAAVERNDWHSMDRILHPDFTLVLGNGNVYSRAEAMSSARLITLPLPSTSVKSGCRMRSIACQSLRSTAAW